MFNENVMFTDMSIKEEEIVKTKAPHGCGPMNNNFMGGCPRPQPIVAPKKVCISQQVTPVPQPVICPIECRRVNRCMYYPVYYPKYEYSYVNVPGNMPGNGQQGNVPGNGQMNCAPGFNPYCNCQCRR